LTLDRVILHTVMHHLSTSIYMPNFIKNEKKFCGRTDVRTDVRTAEGHLRPTLLGGLEGVDLIITMLVSSSTTTRHCCLHLFYYPCRRQSWCKAFTACLCV